MGEIKYDPNDWVLLVPESIKNAETGIVEPVNEGDVGIAYRDIISYGYMFVGAEFIEEYENEDWFEAEAIPAYYPGGGYFIRIDRLLGERGFVGFDRKDRIGRLINES